MREEIHAHTALRGVAACCVVLYHCDLAFSGGPKYEGVSFLTYSYLFVDLFFVLSGFIIAHRYGEGFAGGLDAAGWRRFMLARLIRIYPNYLLWLAVAIVVALIAGRLAGAPPPAPADAARSIALHLAMLQSLVGEPIKWNTPLWSIATEMIAYALFPLAAAAAGVWRGIGATLAAAAAAGALALAMTTTMDLIDGWPSVVRCLCGFGLGMAVARNRAILARSSAGATATLQLAGLVGAALAVTFGQAALALAAFVLLTAATAGNRGPLPALARLAPLRWLGLASYSIYLAHVPVLRGYLATAGGVESRFGLPMLSAWPVFAGAVLGATLIAAALSYRFFERPVRDALTRRFLRR